MGCFPGGSEVKNLPIMQETWVESLGQKDPLEKGMATHSSILAWKIPWAEESGGLESMVLHSQTRLSDQHLLSRFCTGRMESNQWITKKVPHPFLRLPFHII